MHNKKSADTHVQKACCLVQIVAKDVMWQTDLKWRQDFHSSWEKHFPREDCGAEMMEEVGRRHPFAFFLCHLSSREWREPMKFLRQQLMLKKEGIKDKVSHTIQENPTKGGGNYDLGHCPTQNGTLPFKSNCGDSSLGACTSWRLHGWSGMVSEGGKGSKSWGTSRKADWVQYRIIYKGI